MKERIWSSVDSKLLPVSWSTSQGRAASTAQRLWGLLPSSTKCQECAKRCRQSTNPKYETYSALTLCVYGMALTSSVWIYDVESDENKVVVYSVVYLYCILIYSVFLHLHFLRNRASISQVLEVSGVIKKTRINWIKIKMNRSQRESLLHGNIHSGPRATAGEETLSKQRRISESRWICRQNLKHLDLQDPAQQQKQQRQR